MTASAVAPLAAADGSDYASICAALRGARRASICLVGYLLRLGFLANLLSRPILVGYLAGVAFIMMVGQLGKVTGIDIEAEGFLDEIREFFRDFDQANLDHGRGRRRHAVFLFADPHFLPKLPGPLLAVLAAASWSSLSSTSRPTASRSSARSQPALRPKLPPIDLSTAPEPRGPAVAIALVGYSDNVLTARALRARAPGQRSTPTRSCWPSVARTSAPVSSRASRSAAAAAARRSARRSARRTQVYSLVAFVSVLAVFFFLRPAARAVPRRRPRRARDLGRHPPHRRRRVQAAARVPQVGVHAGARHHGRRAAHRHPHRRGRGHRAVGGRPVARIARPHDAVLGRVDGLAGYHDVDDWEGRHDHPGPDDLPLRRPALLRQRRRLPRLGAARARPSLDEPADWFVLQAESIGRIDSSAAQMLGDFLRRARAANITFVLAEAKHDLSDQLDRIGLAEPHRPPACTPRSARPSTRSRRRTDPRAVSRRLAVGATVIDRAAASVGRAPLPVVDVTRRGRSHQPPGREQPHLHVDEVVDELLVVDVIDRPERPNSNRWSSTPERVRADRG